ncbi:MAG: YhcH/YjgK/YiaL family protein [Spirochaetaceae bacterium]|nr:YhcH/YjgK/YiaL family protein [Spirochaetaceae bacterium]
MIVTTFEDSKRYASISPKLERAFGWLNSHNLMELPQGRTDIEGDEIYINRSSFTSKPREEARWEIHHHYLDIQMVLAGQEQMDVTPASLTTNVDEYNATTDYQQVDSKPGDSFQTILMVPGQMTIVFPEDAHRPAIHGDGRTAATIEKAVVKIRID